MKRHKKCDQLKELASNFLFFSEIAEPAPIVNEAYAEKMFSTSFTEL